MMVPEGAMVFGFTSPHRIGTICGPECGQCRGLQIPLTDAFGRWIPDAPPLFIVAEATYEQWRQCVIAAGNPNPRGNQSDHFYYVTTD